MKRRPSGALADRFGSSNVLRFGYASGAFTAFLTALAFVLQPGNLPLLAAIFAVAGLYVAVQEALEATVTAELVPAEASGIAFGSLGTVNGCAKFVSSSLVGILWTTVSPVFAFGLGAALMLAGAGMLAALPKNRA